MGYEYRISFPLGKLADFQKVMLRFGGRSSAINDNLFKSAFSDASQLRPDATVILQPEAIYFCDHGGDCEKVGRLFRQIVDVALSHSGPADAVSITTL